MDYGKIEEWEKDNTADFICDWCDNSAEWKTKDKSFDKIYHNGQYYNFGCPACYIGKVVIPNTEPIESVSDDLIGREVVCVKAKKDACSITSGKKYVICKIASRKEYVLQNIACNFVYTRDELVYTRDDYGNEGGYRVEHFRLLPSRPVEEESEADEPIPYTVVEPEPETTHSAVLEFPNGEQICIPAPEGPEWTGREMRHNWRYHDSKGFIKASKIRHETGAIIYKEYYNRMKAENPRIVSITKWTRLKPVISKTETTVTDWRWTYPLLNGVEK